jgi:hypothetical protein
MLVEIAVLTLSLWLLFLTTDRSRGDSSYSGGGLATPVKPMRRSAELEVSNEAPR